MLKHHVKVSWASYSAIWSTTGELLTKYKGTATTEKQNASHMRKECIVNGVLLATFANSGDPDQTAQDETSDQGVKCCVLTDSYI